MEEPSPKEVPKDPATLREFVLVWLMAMAAAFAQWMKRRADKAEAKQAVAEGKLTAAIAEGEMKVADAKQTPKAVVDDFLANGPSPGPHDDG